MTPSKFELIEGDIADAKTDAIVNAWNRNFIPHWLLVPQGVSKALKKAAGKEPFREIRQHGLMDVGEAIATGAGELDADYIIHVAALHAHWRSSPEAVETGARNAFRLALDLGVSSVAMPLLGAGTGGLEPADSLRLIREAHTAIAAGLDTEVWIYEASLYERLRRA